MPKHFRHLYYVCSYFIIIFKAIGYLFFTIFVVYIYFPIILLFLLRRGIQLSCAYTTCYYTVRRFSESDVNSYLNESINWTYLKSALKFFIIEIYFNQEFSKERSESDSFVVYVVMFKMICSVNHIECENRMEIGNWHRK